jgi:hypothetical protein
MSGSPAVAILMMANEEISSERNFMAKVRPWKQIAVINVEVVE